MGLSFWYKFLKENTLHVMLILRWEATQLRQHDQLFDNAADKPTDIMKNKYHSFCEFLRRQDTELMRVIARKEAERESTDMNVFMAEFEIQLRNWQARNK